MTQITTWINAKLEYVTGTICGVSVMVIDIPHILLKIILAVILGGAGAAGSHLYKLLVSKFKKCKCNGNCNCK